MKRPHLCIAVFFFTATLAAATAPAARAQGILTPRTAELPDEDTYPYVPVNLNRLANDTQGMKLAADHLLAWKSMPFDVARKEGANCLFLKNIGVNGASKDNDGSYASKYDDWREAKKDPARALVRVPRADYKAIWLLAATDDDPKLNDIVTIQLGVIEGSGPVSWQSVTAKVPRAHATAAAANVPGLSATIPTGAGNLYLIRVPFARAISHDFRQFKTFWLEVTKELRTAVNLPDPNRYCLRPAGVPSGVRIHAVTLERSPLEMELTATELGNVFNEPQTPAFRLKLVNVLSDHYIPYTIETVATADDGTIVKKSFPEAFRTGAWQYGYPITQKTVEVPVPKRGHYRLTVNILARGTDLVSTRQTTFALLAPDTRKHRAESPFGTWDFGGGHASAGDPDLRGTLLVKAGLRYGLSDVPDAVRRKYGLLTWGDQPHLAKVTDLKAVQDAAKADPAAPPPARFLIFHEHGISGVHVTRTPDLFTGKKYQLSADEKKTFKSLWDQAAANIPAIRAAFPKAEIYFGNTTPHLLEEFLRHGWPIKDLPAIGNESGCYMRLPETQPPDFVSDNSCLWMLRQIADHYGAKDVPLRQCLEMAYPGANPGNLTEMTQASYLVRHCMVSISWRIPVIRPMVLSDAGNSYYFSNWGSAGLCTAWPNLGPKPAYVAYAVLTQALDGATFTRFVPLDSTSLYAAEFKKKDNTYVTCLWTIRGSWPVTLQLAGATSAKLTNLMGRESAVAVQKNEATIEVSDRPCYLSTPVPISAVRLGDPVHVTTPGKNHFVISPLDKLEDWTIQNDRDAELEVYNFLSPRRQGTFEYKTNTDNGKMVLQVKPKLPAVGPKYLQMYSSLSLKKPVEIKGEPTQIAVLVKGNGGWGRVIFELEDTKGQRWISIGAEQAGAPNPWMADWLSKEEFAKLNPKSMNVCDWNSDDAWGRSYINFDGWRLLKFPLPGQYPGDAYHWPMNSQWRFSGDGVVHYPLRFKRLVVTMPEYVLYGTGYAPPRHYDIQLKHLMALYDPVERVFAGE
jgi:hypothetical protein